MGFHTVRARRVIQTTSPIPVPLFAISSTTCSHHRSVLALPSSESRLTCPRAEPRFIYNGRHISPENVPPCLHAFHLLVADVEYLVPASSPARRRENRVVATPMLRALPPVCGSVRVIRVVRVHALVHVQLGFECAV